jgi:uncharacterized protein (DUF1800 family)
MSLRTASLALHRFGLGPRANNIDLYADDPRAAIEAEMERPGVASLDDNLPDTVTALGAIFSLRKERRQLRLQGEEVSQVASAAMEADSEVKTAGQETPAKLPPAAQGQLYRDEIDARIRRAVSVEIGFVERLVAFWSNHFAVKAAGVARGIVGAFEREAIRPHVLGKFEDMLFAATKHPAMLNYLNNEKSIGPNSRAGKRRKAGLNENHARELLELHTIGVNGGYVQEDVTALARVLTGWTYARDDGPDFGKFVFRHRTHEPGAQTIMGVRYPDNGVEQGEAVLGDLAYHPATARHIASKFARHFVADEPSPGLVEHLVTVFTDTGGDLRAMAKVLLYSDEAWGQRSKLKSPQEFLWSALRTLDFVPQTNLAIKMMAALGQPFWDPPSPQGFSNDSATWLAPDAIADRLDVTAQLVSMAGGDQDPSVLLGTVLGPDVSEETRNGVRRAETREQGLALLLMSPEFQRR